MTRKRMYMKKPDPNGPNKAVQRVNATVGQLRKTNGKASKRFGKLRKPR